MKSQIIQFELTKLRICVTDAAAQNHIQAGSKVERMRNLRKKAEYFVRHSFAVMPAGFYYASFMIMQLISLKTWKDCHSDL